MKSIYIYKPILIKKFMDKKNLKFYEAPSMESIELELEGHLLDASMEAPIWGAREVNGMEEDEEE